MVGISARRVFSREHQVLNRAFVLASFFKVQSDLCRGPRSVFEPKGFETVSQAPMEIHTLRWIQAPVKNLAIQGMSEFIRGGKRSVRKLSSAAGLQELLPLGQCRALFFDLISRALHHSRYRPRGKKLTIYARAFE